MPVSEASLKTISLLVGKCLSSITAAQTMAASGAIHEKLTVLNAKRPVNQRRKEKISTSVASRVNFNVLSV